MLPAHGISQFCEFAACAGPSASISLLLLAHFSLSVRTQAPPPRGHCQSWSPGPILVPRLQEDLGVTLGGGCPLCKYFQIPQGSDATVGEGQMERSGPAPTSLSSCSVQFTRPQGRLPAVRGLLPLPSPLTEEQVWCIRSLSPSAKPPLGSSTASLPVPTTFLFHLVLCSETVLHLGAVPPLRFPGVSSCV